MNDLNVLLVIYASLFISSPLIAIFHEIGHALAYLIYTRPERIDIYIGTYTEPKNPVQFRVGKLHFYVKRSFPFIKGIGLCKSYKAETNYLRYVVILLAGSLFTFIVAAVLSLVVFGSDAGMLVKISCYIFLGLSTLSLISNLVPREIAKDDINLDNDGQQLLFTLEIKNARPDYVDACRYWNEKDYASAAVKFKDVLVEVPNNRKVLNLLIIASLSAGRYEDAALYLGKLEKKYELLPNEMVQKGWLQSLSGNHDEAIETYSKLLKKDRHNVVALNNLAEELIEKGAHKVAGQILEKAIRLKPMFDHPYATLAYSKLLQDDLEAGKRLLKQCLDINPQNAYAYKSLGIYYLKINDKEKATVNFNKALEWDSHIDLSPFSEGLELKTLTSQGTNYT